MSLAPITPYAAAKVLNIVLASKNLERTITPQMMYSYAKNKRIKTIAIANDKKIYFDGDDFKRFVDEYIAGNIKNVRQDFEDLASQYM
jgi:hypothetical protein